MKFESLIGQNAKAKEHEKELISAHPENSNSFNNIEKSKFSTSFQLKLINCFNS